VPERRLSRQVPPASPLLFPLGDQIDIGTGLEAEVSSGPGLRLVEAALVESGQDSRRLGQQGRPVVPVSHDLPQLGHRRGRLRLGGFVSACMPLRDTVQPGDDQPVGVGPRTILNHQARIEHGGEENNSLAADLRVPGQP